MERQLRDNRRLDLLVKLLAPIALFLLFSVPPSSAAHDQNEHEDDVGAISRAFTNNVTFEDLQRMKSAVWLNQDQVTRQVDFTDTQVSPYPSDGAAYDVSIDPTANCYVVFRDPDKITYDMITASDPSSIINDSSYGELNYGVFLSHESPCGVCSNLVDLAVYLETPDLTNPVRLCGFTSFLSGDINQDCLSNVIGFSEPCAAIWFHNTQHTRDNCFLLCILLLLSPNNQGYGLTNPCRPLDDEENDDDGDTPCVKNGCENTINGNPACQDFQYQTGSQYRLNDCLQCDECNSGPLFMKIAGRTRRSSGIESGISRPDIPQISHNYFTANTTTNSLHSISDGSW